MIYPVPFRAEHLQGLELQRSQAWTQDRLAVADQRTLEGPLSSTLMEDGHPLVCVGVVAFTEHRALLWTFFSGEVTAYNFRAVHSWAKKFLQSLKFRRIEATTEVDFEQGNRWLKTLGFKREDKSGMTAFGVDGRSHALYALIKDD